MVDETRYQHLAFFLLARKREKKETISAMREESIVD
jgi:hypothetical protein